MVGQQAHFRLRTIGALALLCFSTLVQAEVVVVVSAENPVESLKANEVADLFLGRSLRFPNGDTAMPVEQSEGSALQQEFYAQVLRRTAAQMKAHWSKLVFTGRGEPPRNVASDAAVLEMLAENPRAVGYIDAASLTPQVKVVLRPE